jgi:hypothetical protein
MRWSPTGGTGGIGSVGEVEVGRGEPSSDGEHAQTSEARRKQAPLQITMMNLDRRVPCIIPPSVNRLADGSVHSANAAKAMTGQRREPQITAAGAGLNDR